MTSADAQQPTSSKRVLVVEDDQAMAVGLQDGIASEGYSVLYADDGEKGLRMAREDQPDLMVLDVMLPKMNGLDVCRQLRGEGNAVPIIMLTARGQEVDKVLGLKMGADDYVTKPFSLMELLARMESVLRRSSQQPAPTPEGPAHFQFGTIEVDFAKHEATRDGQPLEMSAREFSMLRFFVQNQGKVVSRDQLLDAVWGYDHIPFTRTVDAHIAKLRKKIEEKPSEPKHLITVHRLGYKFTG